MPNKIAIMDYQQCYPEKCDHGLCLAVLECEYDSLLQEVPYETPEVDISKWCRGCAKCAQAYPLNAIWILQA